MFLQRLEMNDLIIATFLNLFLKIEYFDDVMAKKAENLLLNSVLELGITNDNLLNETEFTLKPNNNGFTLNPFYMF